MKSKIGLSIPALILVTIAWTRPIAAGGDVGDLPGAGWNTAALQVGFSTYLGGRGLDRGHRIAVDPAGAVYVAGFTQSSNFPPKEVYLPRRDVFVTKLAADGKSLVYTVFFPLELWADDLALGLAVDSRGAVYLAGSTRTRQFPLKNAVQSKLAGGYDGFVLKLAPSGKSLVYSTYLGGAQDDYCTDIAVDAAGAAYVGGWTESDNFPVKKGFQAASGGMSDAFVAKIAPEGKSLVYSTYLGSKKDDRCLGLAVDASGSAVAAGWTNSHGFPIKKSLQPFGGGDSDAFVAKLAPDGKSLVFSSFLGGAHEDKAAAVTLDRLGSVYVTGTTRGGFPIKNGFQPQKSNNTDGFLSKLAADGKSLIYSTYLGGGGDEIVRDIAVDASGAAYVAGETDGFGFPTKDALSTFLKGASDGFLTAFGPGGKGLLASTYLGGFKEDGCWGVAVSGGGGVYLTGRTNSLDFPVKSPYQEKYRDGYDGFVVKLIYR